MSSVPQTEPTPEVLDPDACVVDIHNGSTVSMAVTLHARETRGLGTIQPGRSVRYSEECTSRTWTVTGVPRQAPKAGDSGPPTTQEPTPGTPGPNNASLHPVSVQVEVRPGHVARVVL